MLAPRFLPLLASYPHNITPSTFLRAPNFSCDPKLIAGVTRAMEAGHNQYAAMTGLQTLKSGLPKKSPPFTQYDPAAKCWSRPAPAKGFTRRSADWCIRVMR
jgi:hypothetical protein